MNQYLIRLTTENGSVYEIRDDGTWVRTHASGVPGMLRSSCGEWDRLSIPWGGGPLVIWGPPSDESADPGLNVREIRTPDVVFMDMPCPECGDQLDLRGPFDGRAASPGVTDGHEGFGDKFTCDGRNPVNDYHSFTLILGALVPDGHILTVVER